MPDIPVGPERDRRVAEVVGWEWLSGLMCCRDAQGLLRRPSTRDADALAALEAWCDRKESGEDRGYHIHRKGGGNRVVELWRSNAPAWYGHGETLPSAATAALLASGDSNV